MSADTRGIRERALQWLDEVFGLNQSPTGPIVLTVGGEHGGYSLAKDGKKWKYSEMLAAFAESELAAEREACAQIADDYHSRGTVGSPTAKVIAASIRARQEGS